MYSDDITILCKVVDNYGDIGFVYRLARALSALRGGLHIRIVTDSLPSFALLAPGLDASLPIQKYGSWTVCDWNNSAVCTECFLAGQPRVILECFQCGYPDWLENLLFVRKCNDDVFVINIDYLTAEQYAEDFHCLKSLTRSARVRKVNFMPGFTARTGGLVLDGPYAAGRRVETILAGSDAFFRVLMFSYERDFSAVLSALSKFEAAMNGSRPGSRLRVYVAEGRGKRPFMEAWKKAGMPFAVTELPFLSQQEWDALLGRMSFLFVRGEDSLSRACLSGIPFIWHAYPQDSEYQQVKVQALSGLIQRFLGGDDRDVFEECWHLYNIHAPAGPEDRLCDMIFRMLCRTEDMGQGFREFSASLRANGDFAAHLLAYIDQLI